MNNEEQNETFEVFSLGNGFLVSQDEASSDLIESLLEKGTLWEFLSSLLNATAHKEDIRLYLQQTEAVVKIGKEQKEDFTTMRNQFGNQMDTILKEIENMKSAMATGMIVSTEVAKTPSNNNSANVETAVTKTTVRKSAPANTTGGGFGAKAQRLNALGRK